LVQLQSIEPKLTEMGYQLIAISADRPEKMRESINKHHLKYTLLSDSKMTGAMTLGIAFRVDDETLQRYKEHGIDLEDASGESHHMLPVPAAFVLGTDGVVQFEYINPHYQVRVDPDVLLAAAKAALKK
jgi:peroxiredoxin